MAKTGKGHHHRTDEEKIALIRSYEAHTGRATEWFRKNHLASAMFYKWRQKLGKKAASITRDFNNGLLPASAAVEVVEIPKARRTATSAQPQPSNLADSIEGYIEILKVERRMIDRMIADQEELLGRKAGAR